MKPVLLVDLDATLIDTLAIKRKLFALMEKGAPPERKALRAAFQPFREGNYRKLRFSRSRFVRQVYREFNTLFSKKREYNFPGAEEFLARMARTRELYLLTYGHPRVQKKKIAQAGFGLFFRKIIVTDDPIKYKDFLRLAARHPDLVLVDDSPDICRVARANGVRAVQVRRGRKDARYFRALARRIPR